MCIGWWEVLAGLYDGMSTKRMMSANIGVMAFAGFCDSLDHLRERPQLFEAEIM